MRVDETPFPAGWWGQGLDGVRPDVGTYGRYSHQGLPSLPFEMRGDFGWLAQRPVYDHNIGREKPAENAEALAALLSDASSRGLTVPAEFIKFFGAPMLQHRIRSCTDCFLDLSAVFVPSPVADGFLLRFLADSQGCIFWYLYQLAKRSDACVVASTDFYGADAELWQEEAPDPDEIIFCEESFERFMCRFWLENEIWYSDYEKRPLLVEGARYLESYRRAT
jgi:hypothetical protein